MAQVNDPTDQTTESRPSSQTWKYEGRNHGGALINRDGQTLGCPQWLSHSTKAEGSRRSDGECVKTARFSNVVEKCGEPEAYLLLEGPGDGPDVSSSSESTARNDRFFSKQSEPKRTVAKLAFSRAADVSFSFSPSR
jgi:hypothetical protein